ncbi:MAG: ribokinase [Verrucomicrobiota bacterium]
MSKKKGPIVVVGSLNEDRVYRVASLPRTGETVRALSETIHFGGKGANQAIAAARLEAEVALIGSVGQDEFGEAYVKRVGDSAVSWDGTQSSSVTTGSAFISIDASGRNTIVVHGGANEALTTGDIEEREAIIAGAGLLLCQFEVPMDAVISACECAAKVGVPIFVNPSPFRHGFPWGRIPVEVAIVNEGEAAMLDEHLDGGDDFLVRHLVITRGPDSTLVYGEEELDVESHPAKAVDTVGAGDAFAAALAAQWGSGKGLEEMVRFANVAGALATEKVGAQEAFPDRRAVEERMSALPSTPS